VGERKTLDEHLVKFESLHHLKRIEVPYYDVGLKFESKNRIENSNMEEEWGHKGFGKLTWNPMWVF
jgi:hypothetical protein